MEANLHFGVRTMWLMLLVLLAASRLEPLHGQESLRVCADPNNLPFSNRRQEGFENRIAALVAVELGARLQYTWWPQRRGFVRNTLDAERCDVVIGVPDRFDQVLTTRPYYRSAYALVSRSDAASVHSFADPALRTLRIGVHFTGGGGNPPPAEILARLGMSDRLVGFSLYGDYRESSPPARLIEAVSGGEVDVAVAWGPLAGYFAPRQPVRLHVTALTEADGAPGLPMTFAIAMGVRRGDTARRDRLQRVLDRRATEIRGILQSYGVPLVARPSDAGTR